MPLGEAPDGTIVSVLSTDDSVLCEDPSHRTMQIMSVGVITVFSVGLPVVSLVALLHKKVTYEQETAGDNRHLAQRMALELGSDVSVTEWVVRDLSFGDDLAFLTAAYSPKYLYWESLDMLRKLSLVGLVLVVGRGSMAQLAAAILLSFGFFALQMSTMPYKLKQDNLLRALTEGHVFVVILAAMILRSDLRWEIVDVGFYDWVLFISFIIMVPCAACAAVLSKVRYVIRVLATQTDAGNVGQQQTLALCLQSLGLAEDSDRDCLKTYLDTARVEVATSDFVRVLDGTHWKSNDGVAAVTGPLDSDTDDDASTTPEVGSSGAIVSAEEVLLPTNVSPDAAASVGHTGATPVTELDAYYSKFEGGFEGTFADMNDYYGGLGKMIGDCRKDLLNAMEEEHCDVPDGYGASHDTFVTSSYRVSTTPHEEWQFVVLGKAWAKEMSAGVDRETGLSRGSRRKVNAHELLASAAKCMTESFRAKGFDIVITDEEVKALPLLLEEVIALRLYTGPMFELYNGLLRAYGNTPRGIVPPYALVGAGQDVTGRFTTTLHVLNSGVLKLARLQPAIQVYRGISSMKLPTAFTKENQQNVRGGVEYGFMSTTTDERVAMTFATNGDTSSASTLVVAKMGMVDRGATLDWLSQYPHEQEILLPPLTAMEVINITDFEVRLVDDLEFKVRKLEVRLNTNLISMTIESLLGVRKKQVSELIEIVEKDMLKHTAAADIGRRTRKLRAAQAKVERHSKSSFNDNTFFLEWAQRKVLDLMPQTGDCIEVLTGHTRDVYGLVGTDNDSGFASASWDAKLRVWSVDLEGDATYSSTAFDLQGASLSLVSIRPGWVASSTFKGDISVHALGDTEASQVLLRREGDCVNVAVVAMAALPAIGVSHAEDITIHIEGSVGSEDRTPLCWLATGSMDGRITLWQVMKDIGRITQTVGGQLQPGHSEHGHTAAVRGLLWCKLDGGDVLVSGSFDKSIIVWALSDDGSLTRVKELGGVRGRREAHAGAVTAMAYVECGKASVASASEDGVVKLWNLQTGETTLTVDVCRPVCSLVWMPNANKNAGEGHAWLGCGAGDNAIVIFDLQTGAKIVSMHGHSGAVQSLLWLEAKGWLVSGSSDTTVRTWRIRSSD